ncbi:MAG: hypothetical protein HXS52_04120 [Theionarchaea archaeon]|nr:hypothetical protein [Theionarchaea archaeon]
MKRSIVIMLLFMGLITVCTADDSYTSVVVLANSIERELNTDFIQDLRENREVIVVDPAEFQAYKFSPHIIILGGARAPDTGTITENALPSREKEGASQSMVVTFNVWKNDQVVVILAGPDREGTREACDEHFHHVVSLLDALEVVSDIVGSLQSLVFLWPSPLDLSDQIAPFAPLAMPLKVTDLPFLVPHTLNEETWFFWMDDRPSAKFAHPTRFIFYGIATGACNVYSEKWWPVLNGAPLWVDSTSYWDASYWVHNPGIEKPRAYSAGADGSGIELSTSRDRALLVNGWGSGQPLGGDMAEDERGMREALTSIGIMTETAFTRSEIEQVLTAWSQKMKPEETLLIYITAHGDKGIFLIRNAVFTIHDLITLLALFDEGIPIHIILDTCNAGYSLSPLKSEVELVMAAAGEGDAAYGDCDPAGDINPSDSGSEFTSGLVVTIKELARTGSRINQWKVQAASRNFSWYILLLMESFTAARELDINARSGVTTPLIWTAVTDFDPPTQSPQEESGCPCGGG